MHCKSWVTGLLALAFAGLASCQTPPGYPPATYQPLIVEYGNLTIRPNELIPQAATMNQASSISLPHHCPEETYILLFLDLSLPTANLPANLTAAHTIHGLEPTRSTYLHWFQGNLTQTPDGTLHPLPGSDTIAPYVPPSPNPGDLPHTYAFYLFRQPREFELTGINAGRDLVPMESFDRIGFSVLEVAGERGVELVAGSYLREETKAGREVMLG